MADTSISRTHGRGGVAARLLILVSAVCLAAGLLSPMLETRRLIFFTDAHSLIDVTRALLETGQYLLGLVILVFSILFPIGKAIYLSAVNAGWARGRSALVWVDRLGKWSMIDVFIAAIIVFTLSGDRAIQIFEQPGLYFFTAAITGLMISSGLIANDRA
ncbi:paraquat-inducible protein A [Hyphobacterium sp.]|uniref:paraquat-inducible protein A n=1 Tax=Hyphobacterium sp. TaxID=2004662 RepID=UPI003BAAF178